MVTQLLTRMLDAVQGGKRLLTMGGQPFGRIRGQDVYVDGNYVGTLRMCEMPGVGSFTFLETADGRHIGRIIGDRIDVNSETANRVFAGEWNT